MARLASGDVLIFLIQLTVILGFAKGCGEVARRFRQPAVVGELFSGILLGPSFLGLVFPNAFAGLFSASQGAGFALEGLIFLSVVLLMLVVGLEIEMSKILSEKRQVLWLSFMGIALPILIGLPTGWALYSSVNVSATQLQFSFFLAAALSISALPVIAKVLFDLDLIQTRVGGLILATATLNDLVGWLLFTLVLSLCGKGEQSIILTMGATLLLLVVSLTCLPRVLNAVIPLINARSQGTSLGVVVCLATALSVLTEYIGIHAVFGAFLFGVALAECPSFNREQRETLGQFISNILAPIFFASIGIRVNFFASFDLMLVIVILVAAFSSKLIGGAIGGKCSSLSFRESMSVGVGINARGGMGIILASIAYQNGLADSELFAALVLMAIVTSMTSGSCLRRLIGTTTLSGQIRKFA